MADIGQYFLNHILTWFVAIQIVVGVLAFLLAHKAAGAIYTWFERHMTLSGLREESSDFRKAKTFLKVIRPMLHSINNSIFQMRNFVTPRAVGG